MWGSPELKLPYPHLQASSKCDVWGTHHVGDGFGWGVTREAAGANGPWNAPISNSQPKGSSHTFKHLSV